MRSNNKEKAMFVHRVDVSSVMFAAIERGDKCAHILDLHCHPQRGDKIEFRDIVHDLTVVRTISWVELGDEEFMVSFAPLPVKVGTFRPIVDYSEGDKIESSIGTVETVHMQIVGGGGGKGGGTSKEFISDEEAEQIAKTTSTDLWCFMDDHGHFDPEKISDGILLQFIGRKGPRFAYYVPTRPARPEDYDRLGVQLPPPPLTMQSEEPATIKSNVTPIDKRHKLRCVHREFVDGGASKQCVAAAEEGSNFCKTHEEDDAR
jgi:hypothetical protein